MSQVTLTKREQEILEHIAAGYSGKEISKILFISTETVISHRKNLYYKLQAKNLASLVYLAVKTGALELSLSN